jgi:hypothetical protein
MAIALPNNITHQAFGRLRLSSIVVIGTGPRQEVVLSLLAS